MTFLTIIFVSLFFLSITDFIYPEQKKLHRQLYQLAFFLTYFLFTIKYYYGGDIASYVPMYENIESPQTVLSFKSAYSNSFEIGYLLFCSILKQFNISFWWMTVIISSIYFYVIYKLFETIPSKKTVALFLIVIIDYNLIFAAYRQCLAVSFSILMLLAFIDKKYFKAICFFLLSSSFHKSAIYINIFMILVLTISTIKLTKRDYWVLCILLLMMCVLPLKNILIHFLKFIPISPDDYASIKHHLLLGKPIQVVFFIYLIAIVNIAYYFQDVEKKNRKMQWIVFASLLLVVVLYQQFYLLNRLRSYFIPLIIVYIFSLLFDEDGLKKDLLKSKKHALLFNQLSVVIIYLACSYFIVKREIDFNKLESRIYETSTIFSRIKRSEKEIKKEQMKKAELYWSEDFDTFFSEK